MTKRTSLKFAVTCVKYSALAVFMGISIAASVVGFERRWLFDVIHAAMWSLLISHIIGAYFQCI